jgi:hypothetical protein
MKQTMTAVDVRDRILKSCREEFELCIVRLEDEGNHMKTHYHTLIEQIDATLKPKSTSNALRWCPSCKWKVSQYCINCPNCDCKTKEIA